MATYNILSRVENYKAKIKDEFGFVDYESMSDDVLLKLKAHEVERLPTAPRCTLETTLENYGWNPNGTPKRKHMMFILLDTSSSMTEDMINVCCKHIKSNIQSKFVKYVFGTFDETVKYQIETPDKAVFENYVDNFHPKFSRFTPTKFDHALQTAFKHICSIEFEYIVSFHFITDSIGKIKELEIFNTEWYRCHERGHIMNYWAIKDKGITSIFHNPRRCNTKLQVGIKAISNTDQSNENCRNRNANINNITHNNINPPHYPEISVDAQKTISSPTRTIIEGICDIKQRE